MTPTVSPLLRNLNSKTTPLSEIIRTLNELEKLRPFESEVSFGISANVTCDQLSLFLKKYGFLNQLNARVVQGAFDSHLDNFRSFRQSKVDHVFLLHFFDILVPFLESRVSTLGPQFLADVQDRFCAQLRTLLEDGKSFKTIFIPLFHRRATKILAQGPDAVDRALESFNGALREIADSFQNVRILDLTAILGSLGWPVSINERYYLKFKAPYSVAFLDELARHIYLHLRGGGRYFYKALVLDCDNTLWGGVIGEDLINGIQLNPHDYPGNVFWQIQSEISALQKSGVLLVLCSKNNPNDVEEVFAKHSHAVLKADQIILRKVNWSDKPSNLQEIASELNIGLDSLVFLDDSDFEVAAVRERLPMVKALQVPKNLYEYPGFFGKVRELFSVTDGAGGSDKTEQYKIRAQAIQERAKYSTQEEYLKSLGLKVVLRRNFREAIPRISELTNKSNQFNVTTRRYSESEIAQFCNSTERCVYTMHVSDKFGDSGLTGVAIVEYRGADLVVDSFLMSCRVIGRGVEFAVWRKIFEDARERGCSSVRAEYLRTAKNKLVEEFFDQLGLEVFEKGEDYKRYKSSLVRAFPQAAHVEVTYE